jgi:hypothetical protein
LDIRDRIVSLIATAIFGIVALAFLFLALLNGTGAVIAHFDSQRLHVARPCTADGADSWDAFSPREQLLTTSWGLPFSSRFPTEARGLSSRLSWFDSDW